MPKPSPSLAGYYLLSEALLETSQASDNELRQFSGVANTGKPFDWYGQPTIVDLSGVTHLPNVPVLILHDPAKRCGFGELSLSDGVLKAQGSLLSNEHGKEVSADADEGFPWQMSARVDASKIEEIPAGEQVTVNDQALTGPIVILRQSRISEISFTPTGVDWETEARVLSARGATLSIDRTPPTSKENTMTLEEALKKIQALEDEKAALEQKNEDLEGQVEALKKTAHKTEVDAQLSAAGFKRSEDGKTWEGLSEGTVNLLLSVDQAAAKGFIEDLAPKADASDDADNDVPSWLLSADDAKQQSGNMQLSKNPLVADAESRGSKDQGFI